MQELLAIWKTDSEKITWETPKVRVCCGDRAKAICDSLGVWLCSDTKNILLSRVKQTLICCLSVLPSPAAMTLVMPLTAARRDSQGEPWSHTHCGAACPLGSGPGNPHLWSMALHIVTGLSPSGSVRAGMSLESPFRVRGSRAAHSAELAGMGSSSPSRGRRAEPVLGDETGCDQKPLSIFIAKTGQQKSSAQRAFAG